MADIDWLPSLYTFFYICIITLQQPAEQIPFSLFYEEF